MSVPAGPQQQNEKVSGWSRLASKATNKQVITYKNQASYDGYVNKEGLRHGEGTLVFPNRDARFHGVFEHGAMAKGTIEYLKAGKEQGMDLLFTGTFRDGQWLAGKFTRGTTTYEGHFDGQTMKMNGKFLVEWTDTGAVYDGFLQDDQMHGEGVLTYKEGEIAMIEGTWNAGVLETCKLLKRRDGSTADNFQASSGKLIGEGTVVVGPSTYSGTWDENGLLNGAGRIANEDQSQFCGEFKDNVKEGQGIYTWANNRGEYVGPY